MKSGKQRMKEYRERRGGRDISMRLTPDMVAMLDSLIDHFGLPVGKTIPLIIERTYNQVLLEYTEELDRVNKDKVIIQIIPSAGGGSVVTWSDHLLPTKEQKIFRTLIKDDYNDFLFVMEEQEPELDAVCMGVYFHDSFNGFATCFEDERYNNFAQHLYDWLSDIVAVYEAKREDVYEV